MPQVNITMGAATLTKLDDLKKRYGSRSQVVAVAIDRLWMKERMPEVDEKEDGMCEDCGLFREADGEFILIEPSDCHGESGHYCTQFDADGFVKSTDRPWQVGRHLALTEDEMEAAIG